MTGLRQAAILCGGLGKRLRPYTEHLPKPMVAVNGRPFLQYLVEQLRDQGFAEVVLLTGYRGKQIEDYFGDGHRFGVKISYSHGPVEWETGRRVLEARPLLLPQFLLLYSDNFVPFDFSKLLAFHRANRRPLSLTLSAKSNGNIALGPDGIVNRYDPARSAADLSYVEIGYMLVERDPVLDLIEPPDISFSTVLQRLAARSAVAGMVNGDRYQSISDPERLRLTEQYLRIKRILLIDRDGTLNERPTKADYVSSWGEFHWAAGALDGVAALSEAGFCFILISNQAGIGRGMVSREQVDTVNNRLVDELASRGTKMLDVYICPHHWNDGCACRKPGPGLLFRASHEHCLRLDRTFYIGDDPRDCQAAYNAGCASIFVGCESNLATLRSVERPVRTAPTLADAAPWIIDRFAEWEAVPVASHSDRGSYSANAAPRSSGAGT